MSPKQDRGVIEGTQYNINAQSQLTSQRFYNPAYPVTQLPVTTVTSGKSWGGAQTTTHTEYEEHTISQAQQFSSSQSWGTATAVDTAHAADLTFTYRISNKGTDYAREIGSIAFNIYIGDDANPIYTYYPAADIGGAGTYSNFMPNETHTYASRAVPLTLNQMKAIDTGAHIYIVVEDFSYGVDELFYQDAINSGASFAVDNGDGLLHSYVLPTWGTETIQDVAKRFFPATEDASGNLLSLTVPHYATTPTWTAHALTDTAWWNLYLNNLGDGSAAFKDTPATANSTVLIRMNSDTDRDGYSDRTELALGTNPNDAASHPTPALTAATHSTRTGNTVSVNMAFLNSGNYDAYGIEAVLYAPNSTVTINDNTIGGSGRVKSASQVVLGSRILAAITTNWRGASKPYSTGSYSGNADKVFTFTAANPGNIGQGTVNINWNDGAGNTGTVNFGAGYNAPLPITIRDGLQIGFDTGTVNTGDSFTVATRLPRDTFSYTINQEPYVAPVVVVSYNDPQGNHKFVTPVEVSDLGTNLAPYASQMLPGVGVDISTNAAFNASGNNTVYLVANSPHAQSITNGHLFVEFVNDAGTVVAEQVFTQTLQSGPTVQPVTFNSATFNPAYQSGHDYTLLAFFTDAQGNIIDSHARLFSTFGADPQPVLNTSPATWNIGTVTQGAQPQQTISIVNTGIMPLNVVVNSSDPKLTLSGANRILSIPPAGTTPVTATLDTTALSGAVSMSITIRSNDPAHQTVTVPVNGTVTTATGSAAAFDIANRPLDKTVRVYGNVPQFSTVDFTHGIAPDTTTIEPCKVYAADGVTPKGVGKYCADFNAGTASAQVFGTGADGALTVTGSQTINNTRTALSATSNAGQPTLNVASTSGLAVGQEVLIHQTRGTGAGNYEFGAIANLGTGTITLQRNLQFTYTQDGSSRAQAILVPQYTNITVNNGGTLTAPAWDGTTGGILVFRANGNMTIQSGGKIDSSGRGFVGGTPSYGSAPGSGEHGKQGEGISGPGGSYANGANGNGGSGGIGNEGGDGGGGGGNGTVGSNGGTRYTPSGGGQGGQTAGTPELASMPFGGAGGSGGGEGNSNSSSVSGAGGNGGGIVVAFAKILQVNGNIIADGTNGGNATRMEEGSGGGGGGAGGSILITSQQVTIDPGTISAVGSSGGAKGNPSGGAGDGGAGGAGRIRIEYQNINPGWSTNPTASAQQIAFYITENINYVSFGTGTDGPLTVTTSQIINNTRTALSATSSAGQPTLNVASTSGFAVNQEVLIHQTRGTGAGSYEFGKIASIGSGILTLQTNLQNTYTQGGNSHAQVIRVPHYTDVTVQSGGILNAPAWDGSTGGILIFRANNNVTIQLGGTIDLSGKGYSGGASQGNTGIGYQGEGTVGAGVQSQSANGTGGGGGWPHNDNGAGGGGGGHATLGNNSTDGIAGGGISGNDTLTLATFGGGGGTAGSAIEAPGYTPALGGAGGGFIIIIAKTITVSGAINSNGNSGVNGNRNGGGGGAGGSILLRGQSTTIGTSLVRTFGGAGGTHFFGHNGGDGSVGRIRVEYCDTLSGTTNPAASTQKLNCYIADKPDASTIHFTVPDNVTNGQNYVMQFARHLAFTGAGNQLTYTRVVSQTYASATMDALITNVGVGGATTLTLDIGDDGTIDYTYNGSITQPTALGVPNIASAYNAYITSHTATGGYVDVPVRINITRQADVLLTNLGMTPGAGVDLVVNPGDLALGCPGGASCLASEGNTIPITVTVRNTGAQNAASAVVGYYACDGRDVACNVSTNARLLGNSYVATIPAGGTATANFNWNTEGFTRTQTLYAFVDPPNAIAETLETNNIVSQTLYIKTKPDLRVASIAFSATDRVVGEPITATIVISNTGETTASTNFTRINELGQRGDSSSQDLPTGTIATTSTVTLTTPLSPIFFGTRTITITADATSIITESVETNNVLTRTVFVGINAQNIDAGNASDAAYNATAGIGYLNGSTYDFGGTPGGAITKTVRFDGGGAVQYRFDGLQPSRFYHLDSTFYQEGDSFNQLVSFDGIDSGQIIPLADGVASTTSMLVPSNAYTDTTMIVSFQRQSGGTPAPTRFRSPKSPLGPAFVNELSLKPIEYIYLDAGGANDVAYDTARGYGYLGNNTFATSLGGNTPIGTYRSVFGNTLYYQFDRLSAAKNYALNLTMYDGANSVRVQGVSIDSNPVTSCWNLPVNTLQRIQCPIDPARYTGDGTVIVGIVCSGCTGPRLNEISLEEKTRDATVPAIPPPLPPTTPVSTTVSSFAAQWSSNVVQVTWATVSESKTDNFQLWRSPTLNPATWTIARTQPSQSSCANSTTPFAYNYTDNAVTAGQTYYYKLTWSGDTCGGASAAYPTNAVAYPQVSTSISLAAGWNLISLPISPTIGYAAENLIGAVNTQGGECTEVDRWFNAGWDSHVGGLPFNNFAIQRDTGYFVKCSKLGAWSFQGIPINQSLPLNMFAGWNLISIPYSPTALTAESMTNQMNAQGGDCREVDRWLNGGWDSHITGLPINNFTAEVAKGYFAKCARASSYTPGGAPARRPIAATLAALLKNPKVAPAISDIRVTNVRDTSVSVSWVTNISSQGWVNFGTTVALGSTAYDDRDALIVEDTHHVTLANLSPNTTYYFDLVSDGTTANNQGAHFSVKTGAILGLPNSDVIYGQVFKQDGVTPATGALVYITVTDQNNSGSSGTSAALSAVVEQNGYWWANLGNQRQSGSSSYFDYSASGDMLTVQAVGATDGAARQTGDTSAHAPFPAITLLLGEFKLFLPFVGQQGIQPSESRFYLPFFLK